MISIPQPPADRTKLTVALVCECPSSTREAGCANKFEGANNKQTTVNRESIVVQVSWEP
jgi:hypothetical protein